MRDTNTGLLVYLIAQFKDKYLPNDIFSSSVGHIGTIFEFF